MMDFAVILITSVKTLLKIFRRTGIGKTNKGQGSEVQDLCHLGIE